jgi:3',5'-cyclic AMP phosphodiesterase CpdA
MVAAACPFRGVGDGILHCYLTWQGDTSTTMTINYHAAPGGAQTAVYYDKVSRGGDPNAYALQTLGSAFEIPGLNVFAGAKREIHVVRLTNLEPGQTYYFVAGDASTGFTQEKMFRTVPATGAVNFVTGGDMGTDNVVRSLLAQAALESPFFGLIGGDVAYANGRTTSWREWEKWLDNWESQMVTPGGYTVPMVLAIGNHETNGGYGQFADPTNAAPFYFGYFAQYGAGFTQARSAYFDRWFGDKIRLFVLDSGHVTAIDGAQKTWLETELAATPAGVLTFALYHVPMYPSERNFEGSAALRAAWRPAFDTYGLTAAFENHDHVQKRTKRLVNDTPDANGTLYIGDGCFGRTPRPGNQAMDLENPAELSALGLTENYLAAWSSRRHFWTVNVAADASTVDFSAIDENGVVFDTYTLVP